jgi:conjugative transfer signal peptidase TraF
VVALALLIASNKLKVNLTESMPVGIYLLEATDKLRAGDIAVSCPPAAAQDLGLARGYLTKIATFPATSPCRDSTLPLLKYVAAIGGDVVENAARGFTVNGRVIDARALSSLDRRGRPLIARPGGPYKLRSDDVWLYSPARSSWDSRYFGPVKLRDVIGKAKPLFVATHRWKDVQAPAP